MRPVRSVFVITLLLASWSFSACESKEDSSDDLDERPRNQGGESPSSAGAPGSGGTPASGGAPNSGGQLNDSGGEGNLSGFGGETNVGGQGGASSIQARIIANCEVFSGSGTVALAVDGQELCAATGAAPTSLHSTLDFSCTPNEVVNLSGSCTATSCRAFVDSAVHLDCPFPIPGFAAGSFGEAAGYSGFVSVNCGCR